MTIEVQIKNNDHGRQVEVIEIAIDKETGKRTEGTPHRLAPGEARTWNVYLLRDLLVRESDPG